VGQNHVSETLLNALKNDRLPHALLFTGPRGTGKTSSARILAKSLRCPNVKDFIPCGQCSECEDIASGRAVNVIEIDGASNNGVDAIRELRESVGYMPSTGKNKIYIIDEVHMLSGSAFNALLKTLEEPPPHVVFIMATTEVQKIPNTILSRCQRYDFRRIATRLITDHLKNICAQEGIKADNEALWIIARQGDGSMRDSQSLLDQAISFSNGALTQKKVTEVLGLTDRGLIIDTVLALVGRDQKLITVVIEKLFNSGYDPIIYMRDLLEELRHLMVLKAVPDRSEGLVDLANEEIEHLKKISADLSAEDIHLLFDMALKGSTDLHKAQESRVVLEMVLLRMSVAPRVQQLMNMQFTAGAVAPASQAYAGASQAGASQTQRPALRNMAPNSEAPSANATPSGSATPAVSSDEAKWLDLVDKIKKVNGVVAAKIEHMHVIKLTSDKIEIGIPDQYKFLTAQVSDAAFKKKISNYITTFWGANVTVEFKEIAAEKSPTLSANQITQKKSDIDKKKVEDDVENHPLVKSAKTIFNTQITSIKEGQ
jgi:DNA polymerase III subunit gamma/tau